jgi:MoaA/NifB/PqqE/SkfB family radical SAM enzyme
MGVEEVIFSGGEPLLRRDIYDLMEYAHNLGLQVRIITNGTGLSEAGMNRMAELGVAKIGISLDSLDPDRFAAIRGLDLRQVMRAIDMLAMFKAEHYQDLYVSLYATIVRLNIDDLVPMAEFAMERSLSIQYQPVHFAGTGISERVIARSWPAPLEIDRLGEVVRELVHKKTQGYPIGNREQFLSQIPGFFRRRTFHPERCFVGYTGITIDQDLGLRPCWAMEPVAHFDHRTTSLHDLWHSREMRQVRKAIRLNRCPGCLYSCHLNKSYVPLRGSKRGAAQLLS